MDVMDSTYKCSEGWLGVGGCNAFLVSIIILSLGHLLIEVSIRKYVILVVEMGAIRKRSTHNCFNGHKHIHVRIC